jgi:CheY-like chemotaxis protein
MAARNIVCDKEAKINNEVKVKLKLLVLDDDKDIRLLLNAILKKRFDVTPISNVSDLMIHAEASNPDLVLLDLNMPNIDGYEVLDIIRAHSSTAAVPVVCMSSDDSAETRVRIREAGACGFIRKPFHNESLVTDLEAIFESLNKVITSKDELRQSVIAHNEDEKYNLIHELIKDGADREEQMIFLSWQEGANFLTPLEQELVESEKLVFLEIKPSLIVKFPYIQEVSPVFDDIFQFISNSSGPKHLIFDELRNILNVYDQERALAKSYSMASFIRTAFRKTSIFNTRPSTHVNNLLLEKISKIFVGRKQ